MDAPRAGVAPEDRQRGLPEDSEQFSPGLDGDSYPSRAKLVVGAPSVALLAVVTAGPGIALGVGVSRRAADRRR